MSTLKRFRVSATHYIPYYVFVNARDEEHALELGKEQAWHGNFIKVETDGEFSVDEAVEVTP